MRYNKLMKFLKGSLSVFILIVGVVFIPAASYAATIGAPQNNLGLISRWTFDGNSVSDKVYDSSGNSNNGYFYNGATSSAKVLGKVGQALSFDGTDDYVLASDSGFPLVASQRTVCSWFQVSLGSGWRTIFQYGARSSLTWFGLLINPSNQVTSSLYGSDISSGTTDTDGLWHHACITYDGTTRRLYLDGVQKATDTTSLVTTSGNVMIGRNSDLAEAFPGNIDDVRVYNRALSAAEVKNMYQGGESRVSSSQARTGLENGLVAHWTFDGKDTVTAPNDTSGNGNNGILVGHATPTGVPGKLGQALSFDGSTDGVRVGYNSSLDTPNAFTAAIWIYDDGDGNQGHTFNRDDGSSDRDWIIRRDDDTTGNYHIWNSGGTLYQFKPANSWKIREWFHTAFVAYVSGSNINMEVFINGESVGTASFAGTAIKTGSSEMHMGYGGGGGLFKRQSLDDARLYNRALSATEIRQLYSQGSGFKTSSNQTSTRGSLDSGLLGYWSMNGADVTDKIYDRSGNGNHGYFYNGATTSAKTSGVSGQALSFDGVDDYVRFPDISLSGSYSVSLWSRMTSLPGLYHLIAGNYTGSNGLVSFSTVFWLYPSNVTGASITINQWNHVVYVQNSNGLGDMYVNGILVVTNTGLGSLTFSALGNDIANEAYGGLIDEVRVYNRALSDAEVRQLCRMGGINNCSAKVFSPTDIAGLKLWLKPETLASNYVNNDPVSTWSDVSGNGNDATASGSLRPLLKAHIVNGKSVIRCDGTDDYMTGTLVNSGTTITQFVVFSMDAASGAYGRMLSVGQTGHNDYDALMYMASLSRYSTNNALDACRSYPSACVNGNIPATPGTFYYYTQESDGSTFAAWGNGTSYFSPISQSGTFNITNYNLCSDTVPGQYGKNDIAEVIIYNTALNTADRQKVEAYLKNKYGL